MAKIVINGEPKALQRHRTKILSGQQKQYDPQAKLKMVTRNIILCEKQIQHLEFLKDKSGYELDITFFCYRPPSMRSMEEDEINKMPHCRKPDLDNMIKYILDCGNQILWNDDSEIFKITAEKVWSKKPRTEITINY